MGGTVIARNGQEGMYVETGTPIYTIADLSRMWVLLDAYESDLPWLKYGERVTFTTEAFPGETFEGRIAFIDPFVDPRTRTVNVRVNVENPDGKLKADMFVRATAHPKVAQGGRVMDPALAGKWISPMHPEIVKDGPGTCDVCGMALVPAEELGYVSVEADAEAQPLVIPASAALVTGKRAVVYVEVPDTERPTYEGREVVLGPRAGDHYIVRAGVEEGDRVVTAGNFKIDSALQIQAKPSMMTPDGGGAEDEAKAPLAPDAREALADLWNYRDTFAAALEDSDLTGAQRALMELRGVIADFQADLIPTAHVATWTEYSRRITNDTVEGLHAEDVDTLGPVVRSLDHNLGMLAERFAYDPEMNKPLDEAIPHAFRAALGKVYGGYLDVQRSLAGDDPEASRSAAQQLASVIEGVPSDSLGSAATVRWIPLYDAMLAGARKMAEASDLDTQRVHFEDVSESLATAVRTFGIMIDTPIFEVHCPMAFDFAGANWLQDSEDILNPYFGDEMLTCGTVVGPLTGSSDGAPMDHAGHEGHNHE
jgi:Cu(I)/Ag(I) efflux system membrane fusion protein